MKFQDPNNTRLFEDLAERIKQLIESFDMNTVGERIDTLSAQSASEGFWDDPDHARTVMQELEDLRGRYEKLEGLSEGVEEIELLLEMAEEEPASAEQAYEDARARLNQLDQDVSSMEVERLFSGEHDDCNVLMEINSGAGGTEAQDWAEMLLRMYLRWAEQTGTKPSF